MAVPIVVLLAAVVGLLIGAPVLRLRGDYLAIVTLGLGEIVSVITASKWAQPLIGGPQGMRGVTKAEVFGLNFQDNPQHFYYLALAFVLLAAFVSWRLSTSRIGRAWNAMREDEQVADAMGISTTKFKLLAFALGGAIGSLGGALFAVSIGSLTPASFKITRLDHRPRRRDPRWARQHPRRGGRRPGADRPAGAPARVRGVPGC